MSVISRMRNQTALYWERLSAPNEYGQYTFAPAVEVACRWDDVTAEMRDPQGVALTFSSIVYVDREMKNGDMLAQGELESDSGAEDDTDPVSFPGAKPIQKFAVTPNFKATENLYTAYL